MSFVSLALSPSVSRIVHEVADRDALAQQGLQHALHLAERQQVGHELLDRRRRCSLRPSSSSCDVLAAEQLGGVARG